MAHREGIRDYLRDIQVHGLVYDWGCGTKPIKNYLKTNDAKFVGIDKLNHVGADIIANLEVKQDFGRYGDFAFCLEVIEHIWDSKTLLENIINHLKIGGVLYFSQPYQYETHKEDDRIRYTHHGLMQLLTEAGFSDITITPTVGDLEHADGFVGSARK